MSTPTPRDHACRGPVRRPPTRTHYPDLSRRASPGPLRTVHDPATGQRFTLRFLPGRIGNPAQQRFEVKADGEPPQLVTDHGDYHECQCAGFHRDWECPHARALIDAGLIVEARFALASSTTAGGRHE